MGQLMILTLIFTPNFLFFVFTWPTFTEYIVCLDDETAFEVGFLQRNTHQPPLYPNNTFTTLAVTLITPEPNPIA